MFFFTEIKLHSLFPCWLIALLMLSASCSVRQGKVSYERSFFIIHDSLITPDSAALALIMPYKKKIDKEMNDVLVISEMPLVKGQPESSLGNLIADLVLIKGREYYKAEDGTIDFCLLNNGGLRTALPQGEITRGKVYELMPFENEMTVLTLDGESTRQLFNYIARSEGMPVSGVRMGIQKNTAVRIFINDTPFDPEKNYKIVTSDYLANGGDKMAFFNQPVKRENLNIKLRDAIIEYFIEQNDAGKKLNSNKDGRIYFYE
jgi:2',3'-cyclic-nucleotide 2'-phosphodiesterase (5'-nucleotidase family)